MNIDGSIVINELRPVVNNLIRYTETAEMDLFLQCYADIPQFIAISGDGIVRNYSGPKAICTDYYRSVNKQVLTATRELFNVPGDTTVVVCWPGNIDASFKNGDAWKMRNYTVTLLYKKLDGEWKAIHSHESALPPGRVKAV